MKSDIKTVFHKLEENIANFFRAKYLPLHFLAILLTYLLVTSGFDWFYFLKTQGVVIQAFLIPASIIGGTLPIILPVLFYALGKKWNNRQAEVTAMALAQAGIIALLLSSFFKAFTGRIQPPRHALQYLDISRNFEFGFLRHGVFWGWPSSHTTVAFALALTLFIMYRKNTAVKILAIIVALYIGIGVSTNIHWFSDVVAGVIFGSVIGVIVGKSFSATKL